MQKAAAEAEGKTPESEEDFLKRKKDNGDIDGYKTNGDGTPSEITIGGKTVPIIDGKPSDPQKADNGSNTGSSSGSNPGSTSGGSSSSSGDDSKITYTDTDGNTKKLTKDTPASDYGTKIGNTTITNSDNEEIKLDWYLFDVSDDGKTAYLVSTPTYWVPDTTKVVSGAYTPKLVSSPDSKTGAIRQAIQEKESGTAWDSYTYEKDNLKYTPSDKTWNYYKSVNSQWSAQRGSTAFASLNENEQSACYLADADIFAGIKDQVNNAEGNLKGKIQTLVGGASAEQWCKAYNKQSAAKDHQITCEYRTSVPGYIYKVNGNTSTVSNSEYWTGNKTIVGNDIYGAAYTYNRSDNSTYPFSSCIWWLASPSSNLSDSVCSVYGNRSDLDANDSYIFAIGFSLFASVAL